MVSKMFAVIVALLVATSTTVVIATSPPTISFYVTVRDFMPQPCRLGTGVTTSIRDRFCPNDTTTKTMVLNGTISGHPDFQRVDYASYGASLLLYTPFNGPVGPYNGTYAKFGQPFPVTFNDPSPSRPFVLSTLAYDTAGIPKMRFCDGSEGYICDSTQTSGPGYSVMNSTTFSTWYNDAQRYNIRSGYKQSLKKSGSQYKFDSSTDTPKNFYDPIQNSSLPGWPLSVEEITYQSSKKFWFTTEIHNSFQYKGGEIFFFSGDDDVHVFINNRLALNLGGLHAKTSLTLNVSKYERELGLEKGKIYQFDLFHAERQVVESNYAITTTLSEACNVITSDLRSSGKDVVSAIDWTQSGATNNSNFVVISGPGFGYFEEPNKTMVLMKGGVPNAVSYMFFNQRQNVGSGFAFSFKFKMTGLGHGFAVLFHDRQLGLQDFNGGTGPNLGIKNTDNSFAIAFDMCPNYPGSCNSNAQIRIHYKLTGDRLNSVDTSTRTVYDPNVLQNWRDGKAHNVEVFYYALPDWLEVYVDNSLRLVERNFSMKAVIGGRDASVGFSASSSDFSTMDVRIYDVTMKTVKVTPRFSLSDEDPQTFPKTFVANERDSVSFTIQTADACKNPVEFGGFSNLVSGRLIATSVSADPPSSGRRLQGNTTLMLMPEVVDLQNGKYSIKFKTNVLASFDAYMAYGTNCTWNGTAFTSNTNCFALAWSNAAESIPFSTAAPTVDVAPDGLGSAALAGIGVAVGVISFCGSVALFVGVRIRNQWRRDKRFVDEGRRIVAERGVEYMGDNELDILQNKLQATLHALQAERAKRAKPEDKQDVIDELLRQKGELQEIVRRLKIKAEGGDPEAPGRMTVGARVRKSFAGNRISARISRGASLFNPAANEAASSNPLFTRLRQSISSRPREAAVAHAVDLKPEDV